jgi:hypothetical protein
MPTLAHAQLWSGILDPSRGIDWTQAGVVGGIPSATWTQCGSTLPSTSTVAQVQAAINACGTNQFVQLGSGNFSFSTFLNMKSNMVLRGLGANQTTLTFGSNAIGGGCFLGGSTICFTNDGGTYNNSFDSAPGQSNAANWTAGFSQGTTSITVGSVGSVGIRNGQYIYLDQANDTAPNSNLFICDIITTCAIEGASPGRTIGGVSHSQLQAVKVTAGCATLCTGAGPFTLTITPGLYGINWSSSKAPGAWFPTIPISNAGVENLTINNQTATGDNGSTINFMNAFNCWVTGVASLHGGRAHVWITNGAHITVQNNYFYQTQDAASQSYGIEVELASDTMVVNNIFQQVTAPNIGGSEFGNVYAYNYSINHFQTGSVNCMYPNGIAHDAAAEYNLWEGNFSENVEGDDVHGTSGLNTLFRNIFTGYELGKICSTIAIVWDPYNRDENVVGNILGTPGITTLYYITDPFNAGGVYDSGLVHGGIGPDSVVGTTMLRWGNYDNVTGFVRWCGNSSDTGWSNVNGCNSTSEVPTSGVGSPSYANAVPSKGDTGIGQSAMPASFIYASQPSWWPSGKPWPPAGPDISSGSIGQCTSGTYSGLMATASGQCAGGTFSAHINAGHANSNPAMDCFLTTMAGPPDGSGNALSFNAATCYSAPANAPTVSLNPTSLSFGAVNVGKVSAAQTVTLTNTGTATLNITSIAPSDATNYAISANTCGATLTIGNNCIVSVTFNPTTPGVHNANLIFMTNASTSPNNAPLSGTGVSVTPVCLETLTELDASTGLRATIPQQKYACHP